jgi:hypothetical protein
MATAPAHPLLSLRPQLRAIRSGADALGLGPRELLHAGPPLRDPCRPPHTLASSVVMTCLLEGWASTESEAEALLHQGALTLTPAQDRACVTPLAAVVSAGTPLFEVGDAAGPNACWAPVGAVRGADTRMGWRDATLPARLRHRDVVTAPALQALLQGSGPIDLWPLAVQGLAAGDDLHASTAHANQALVSLLRAGATADLADDVAATPLFFLTLWMAASAWLLRSAERGGPATCVTRAGGNGERFAIALAASPAEWLAVDATPPTGPRLPGVNADLPIEGAIGDSAVIDMLGLGGQRLAQSPDLLAIFGQRPECNGGFQNGPSQRLMTAAHPLLPDHWPLALDAARVVEYQQTPRVMLAMLARDGRAGLCGRGIYRPPLSLFENALSNALRHVLRHG